MDIIASILRANSKSMLVKDFKTNNNVLVYSHMSHHYLPGDCVRIKYNGIATRSTPPKITADLIWRIECPD